MWQRLSRWAPIVSIFAFSAVVFHRTLFNYFTNWDDTYYLSFEGIHQFDLQQIFSSILVNNYFPFTLLGYALDSQICYPEVWCFHLSSLLLHLGNAVLFYFLVERLMKKNRILAVLSTFLFAIHPLQVEAVAWMSAKNYPQSFFFYLSSLHLYVSWREKEKKAYYILSLAAFVVGLLTKHIVFITPVVLWSLDFFYFQKRSWKGLLPFWLGALATGITAMVLYWEGNETLVPSMNLTGSERVVFWLQNILFYLGKLLAPFQLSALYDSFQHDFRWYDFAALAVWMTVLVISLLRGLWKDHFWRQWFVIAAISVLPFIKLVPFGSSSSFSDRYLYFGIGFIFLWLFYSLQRLLDRNAFSIFSVFVIAIGLGFSVLTFERIAVWQNPTTLWADVLEKNPTSAAARLKLAELYLSLQDWPAALEQTQRGLEKPSRYSSTLYYQQALCYLGLRQKDKAVASLEAGLQEKPDFVLAQKLLNRLRGR